MGHRLWIPAVVIHRLGIVEIAPSPHRCFRTANPCAQSVNSSPAEPVLSISSRQRLGHLQSHFDRGWHVCQAVFPELQPGTSNELVSSHVNTELKCIFNSSAIKNPSVIIFPALSSSGPTLPRTFCLLLTYA